MSTKGGKGNNKSRRSQLDLDIQRRMYFTVNEFCFQLEITQETVTGKSKLIQQVSSVQYINLYWNNSSRKRIRVSFTSFLIECVHL